MTRISWQVASVTDPGIKRKENQDNLYVSPDNRVLVVADGMGGMKGGSKASQLAVDAVEYLYRSRQPDEEDASAIQNWLQEACSNANKQVFRAAASDPAVKDMGTTIVAAVHTKDGRVQISHVGDSRAYLVRDGKTTVLTQDHSVVMEMLLQGKMNEEQLRNSPFRHYLTRCVGHKSKVEIDNTPHDILPGDWMILSSDGLSTVVTDAEIGEVAKTCTEPEELCKKLLQATLDGGAPDNVTIIVVKYAAEEAEGAEEGDGKKEPAGKEASSKETAKSKKSADGEESDGEGVEDSGRHEQLSESKT